MQVTVVSGSGLKGDIIGAPDVYVVLKHGGQVHKTSVISNKDPVWRQTFQISVNTEKKNGFVVGKGTLDVEVWDKDRLSKDDLLGTGVVDLASLEWNRNTPKVIELKKGQVTLEIKATEFGIGKQTEPQPSKQPSTPPPPPQEQHTTPAKQAPDFPVYQGPYHYEGEDIESRYRPSQTFTTLDDIEARRMHEVLDTFPTYQGYKQALPTPSRHFRPSPEYRRPDPAAGWNEKRSSGLGYTTGGGQRSAPYGARRPASFRQGPPLPPPPLQSSGVVPPPAAPAQTSSNKKRADIGTLHITVMRATGLKSPTDCTLRLKIEDKKIETTVKKDTIAPQWNESFKFFVRLSPGNQPGIRLGRTATMPLQLTLLDKKTNEEIGTAIVPLQDLYEGKGTEIPSAELKDNAGNTVGEVSLTLKPLAFGLKVYKGRLHCKIEKAIDLRNSGTAPDTYVVMRLRDEKQTTQVVRSSTDPEWQEEFVFSPDVFEKRGVVQCPSDLIVELMAKVGGREEKLGAGTVPLDGVIQRMTQKKTIDLIEQGKLYLQIEAENFGLPVSEEPVTRPPAQAPAPEVPIYHTYQQQQQHQQASRPAVTEKPATVDYGLPAAATTPAPPAAPAGGRYAFAGVPALDADDAAIATLKQELYELRRQGTALEKENSEKVIPLQMELNVVRAQLDRANVHMDRLQAPVGHIAMDTFGHRRSPSPTWEQRGTPTHSPPHSPAGSAHSPARSPTRRSPSPPVRYSAALHDVPVVAEVPEFQTIDDRNPHKTQSKPYSAFDPSGRSSKQPSATSAMGLRESLADRTNRSGHVASPSGKLQPAAHPHPTAVGTSQRPIGQSYFIDPFTGQHVSSLAELSFGFSTPPQASLQPASVLSPKPIRVHEGPVAVGKKATSAPPAQPKHTKTNTLYDRAMQVNRSRNY